jgi:hypothetical protein
MAADNFNFMRRLMKENLEYLTQIKEMKEKIQILEKSLELVKEMYLVAESARIRLGMPQDPPLVTEDKDANPLPPV